MMQAGLVDCPGAFHTVLAPGLMLVLTVMSVNIFGDGTSRGIGPTLVGGS